MKHRPRRAPPPAPASLGKKVWHFIWHEESIWSWIVNVVLAFVLIKFIVYPALGFALGTTHPVVAVVSSSMEHRGTLDAWWGEPRCCRTSCLERFSQSEVYGKFGIDRAAFGAYPFRNGFNKGDLMVLASPKALKEGDIAVFATSMRGDPVIHRVIDVQARDGRTILTTKGDFNCDLHAFEREVPQEAVVGRAVLRIPLLGWIKIGAVELINALARLAR
jgi:hypothetical protein